MNIGDCFDMTITSFDSEGRGIGHIEGYTVFVENAVVGDRITVRLTKRNKTYGFGRLFKLLSPSPYRVKPPCPYFHQCGACSLLHIDYAEQLIMKHQLVQDALTRIGGFSDITVAPVVGSEPSFYYRNKSQFPVCLQKGKTVIGFYQKQSHNAFDMETCLVSSHLSCQIAAFLREFMQRHSITPYDEATHTGLIRHLFVRTTADEASAMVILVTNGVDFPCAQAWVQEVVQQFPQITSLYQNINDRRTNLILGRKNRLMWGDAVLYDTLLNKRFMISPASFYQINHQQTERLYQKAIALAAPTKQDIVFDLYCGIGTISLCMADCAKKVIGVEIVEDAIQNARQNATLNSVDNAEFYVGAAETVVPALYQKGLCADIVVLDPPRKGADAALISTILSMKPSRIVYISCNPATLARDCRALSAGGYTLDSIHPFDMFCHTGHVESVALMSKVR